MAVFQCLFKAQAMYTSFECMYNHAQDSFTNTLAYAIFVVASQQGLTGIMLYIRLLFSFSALQPHQYSSLDLAYGESLKFSSIPNLDSDMREKIKFLFSSLQEFKYKTVLFRSNANLNMKFYMPRKQYTKYNTAIVYYL